MVYNERPTPMNRARLAEFGIAEKDIAKIETEVKKAVDDATETAKASPVPANELIMRDVYADGGAAWRN